MSDDPMEYDLKPYLWLVVVGAFGSFFAAFGIGANDVANAYATSVGSRALTIKQACVLAFICEFLGAFLGGSSVRAARALATFARGAALTPAARPAGLRHHPQEDRRRRLLRGRSGAADVYAAPAGIGAGMARAPRCTPPPPRRLTRPRAAQTATSA